METKFLKQPIICLTGPESSGKTTLAKQIAIHFEASLVPEIARSYLEERYKRGITRYRRTDLIKIAKLQIIAEEKALTENKDLVICDTDLLVLRIWHEEKYGFVDPSIKEMMKNMRERYYLVTTPDIPWEKDVLRESKDDRGRLLQRHVKLLSESNSYFKKVSGNQQFRLETAIDVINTLLQ